MISLRDSAWFSGFVDGEATFYIQGPGSGQSKRDRGHLPGLAICLRADDAAILVEIRREWSGNLNLRDSVAVQDGRKPQIRWSVHNKAALASLIDYFDRHPLRTKKARDYAFWREAVVLYLAYGRNHPDLAVLKARMESARLYEEPGEVVELRALRARGG